MIAWAKDHEGICRTFIGLDAEERAWAYVAQDNPADYVDVTPSERLYGVQVRDLRPGDVLIATRTTIVSNPSAGVRTPRAKLDLAVAHWKGGVRRVTWGRYTTMSILRPTLDKQPASD